MFIYGISISSANVHKVKIPKPKDEEGQSEPTQKMALPQTLVRIPTEHAPALQNAVVGGNAEA